MLGVLVHIPVGLVNIAIMGWSAPAGLMFGVGFIAYEVVQEWLYVKNGESHRDIQGWLIRMAVGSGLWWLVS